MFIGREKELAYLNDLYETDKFQFPVIYGRRRIGKTALINEFSKNKDTVYFAAIESSEKQNLENFSRSIFQYTDKLKSTPIFSSFQNALEYVFDLSKTKRLILVIDEYPYVAKAIRELSSVLQMLIDRNKDESKMFLILCGSSMSFMEKQVLGYESPLYGRRTAQFKIEPFDFFESAGYFRNFSKIDMATIYGIVGGTPQYLLQMSDDLSMEENIKKNILRPTSYLFEEPNNLLKQEVKEASTYNAIISAIATGSSRPSEIANKISENINSCSAYLENLVSLGLIKKETPFLEKGSKRTIYSIEDNLFKFWYRFIPANISLIQNDMIELAYANICDGLSSHMGAVFEDICKQYLWKLNKQRKAAFTFTKLGRWWGNDPRNRKETEIDIICVDNNDKSAIFCECKWTNEKVDNIVLDTLIDRSKLFHYTTVFYYVFSKSGFTKGIIENACRLKNVTLISFDDIL